MILSGRGAVASSIPAMHALMKTLFLNHFLIRTQCLILSARFQAQEWPFIGTIQQRIWLHQR